MSPYLYISTNSLSYRGEQGIIFKIITMCHYYNVTGFVKWRFYGTNTRQNNSSVLVGERWLVKAMDVKWHELLFPALTLLFSFLFFLLFFCTKIHSIKIKHHKYHKLCWPNQYVNEKKKWFTCVTHAWNKHSFVVLLIKFILAIFPSDR